MPELTLAAPAGAAPAGQSAPAYVVTLFVPGQPARVLTPDEVAPLLHPTAVPGEPVRCQPVAVAAVLTSAAAVELAADQHAAVWAVPAEPGAPARPDNSEAEYFVWGLFGEAELSGPVVVVESTLPR